MSTQIDWSKMTSSEYNQLVESGELSNRHYDELKAKFKQRLTQPTDQRQRLIQQLESDLRRHERAGITAGLEPLINRIAELKSEATEEQRRQSYAESPTGQIEKEMMHEHFSNLMSAGASKDQLDEYKAARDGYLEAGQFDSESFNHVLATYSRAMVETQHNQGQSQEQPLSDFQKGAENE